MGQLLNGKWTEDQPFTPGPHAHRLGTTEFPFDPVQDKGRYHLYVSNSCPFANRTQVARALKGLESVIGLSVTHPAQSDEGWSFAHDKEFGESEGVGDKVLGKKFLHEVYTAADPNYTGRVTVPLLVDTKPGSHSLGGSGKIRIVSNESADIVDIFNKVGPSGPDLSKHAEEQKKVGEITQRFTSNIYKVGNAPTQADYDTAIDTLYGAIDAIDKEVAKHEFLVSDNEPTAIDVLVFPFLARIDTLYSTLYLITRARLSDYPHIDVYFRRFYQLPGVKNTINLHHIRKGNFNERALKKIAAGRKEVILPALPRLDWDKPLS